MNKNEDFYNDEFIKKLLSDVQFEEPSEQFTNKVMDKVMQDWLAKPIEMKRPISRNQWIWIIGVVSVVVLILLGTDVRTLINSIDHPFFNQLDATLLQPIHQVLTKVAASLAKLPIMVYIIATALGFLAAFDGIINKLVHYR